MAIIIRTDGSSEIIFNPTFEQLRKAVGGDIEYVPFKRYNLALKHLEAEVNRVAGCMYCHGEGYLIGLEYNERATELIGYDVVGNVVVLFDEEER